MQRLTRSVLYYFVALERAQLTMERTQICAVHVHCTLYGWNGKDPGGATLKLRYEYYGGERMRLVWLNSTCIFILFYFMLCLYSTCISILLICNWWVGCTKQTEFPHLCCETMSTIVIQETRKFCKAKSPKQWGIVSIILSCTFLVQPSALPRNISHILPCRASLTTAAAVGESLRYSD